MLRSSIGRSNLLDLSTDFTTALVRGIGTSFWSIVLEGGPGVLFDSVSPIIDVGVLSTGSSIASRLSVEV
jgi:hypothetical protein